MSNSATNWVADKLVTKEGLEIVERTPEDFLVVKSKGGDSFIVAVLGVQNIIELSDVEPLFASANKPQFVVNIPSKARWGGAAINYVHAASAAFGTLSEVAQASYYHDPGCYREKNVAFYFTAMDQHSHVSCVSYVYETAFRVDRKFGPSLIVAIVDAYNMSAEDVRNAKTYYGHFDIALKSTSYGSITSQAHAAAKSMGAEALMFGELMSRLAKK
jgi:hypothetical protein